MVGPQIYTYPIGGCDSPLSCIEGDRGDGELFLEVSMDELRDSPPLFDSATARKNDSVTLGARRDWQLFAIEGEASKRTLPLSSI